MVRATARLVWVRVAEYALLALLVTAGAGCERRSRGPRAAMHGATSGAATTATPDEGALPSWVPAATPEQARILQTSRSMQVRVAAQRVYPRLELFAYGKQEPFDERRAAAALELVERATRESPHLYVVGVGSAAEANVVAQYGPPAPSEPDRWVRVVADSADRNRLAWAAPPPETMSAIEAGNRALAAGVLMDAVRAFSHAARAAPKVPALFVTLAEAHSALGDDVNANHALDAALDADPRYPDAHRVLALIQARRGDADEARASLARALALHPSWALAWSQASDVAQVLPRPAPPRAFMEVGANGAIHVATPQAPAGRAYGTCRAVLRYEETLRRTVLGLGGRYHLSVGEEQLCLEAALAVYANTREATPDPVFAYIEGVARDGLLQAFVLFEIIGPYRPEWLRVAPSDAFESVREYVGKRVLSAR